MEEINNEVNSKENTIETINDNKIIKNHKLLYLI